MGVELGALQLRPWHCCCTVARQPQLGLLRTSLLALSSRAKLYSESLTGSLALLLPCAKSRQE